MAQSAEMRGAAMRPGGTRRAWPNEINIFIALIIIVAVFEILNRLNGTSFLFNTRANVSSLFNEQRINIMLLQVAITGIIAIGVTQVIIIGGIDLSSGSVVGATAMITMSFAQTAIVNGNPNPKAIFGPELMDLPVIVPIVVGLACGLVGGPDQRIADRLHQDSALHRDAGHDGVGARRRALVVERQPDLVSHRVLRRAWRTAISSAR